MVLLLCVLLHRLGRSWLGADVNTPIDSGYTPVCLAAEKGHEQVIRALVELGANVNTASKNGTTPVCIAAEVGRVGVLRALVELGADLNTPVNCVFPRCQEWSCGSNRS
jgi:ankyrin repeat protein